MANGGRRTPARWAAASGTTLPRNCGAVETHERLRLESEHQRERPVEHGEARFANGSRDLRRMKISELRVGVLEVQPPYDHHNGRVMDGIVIEAP